jgi:hypothetical protein
MEFGPEIPRWPHVATAIAKMMSMRMLRWASSCSTENGYSKLMLSAPLIGFIAVRDRYAQEQCLQASRIWQRAHLFATAHGLAARPCNEAVEMVDHERALGRPASRAALLNEITADPTWQPTFVFYMGDPKLSAHASPRRPVEAVLVWRPRSRARSSNGEQPGELRPSSCNLAAD